MDKSYKIIRLHRIGAGCDRIIKTGLTLEEAQAHCKRKDTRKINESGEIVWFDGYESEI